MQFEKKTIWTMMYTVKPELTTTCDKRPPVNNGQFETSTASLNLSFIRPLFQTATFFRSQGRPLYTGLTVLEIGKTFLIHCYPSFN